MTKQMCAHWFLQRKMDEIVGRLVPGCFITPEVRPQNDKVVWDDRCCGVGRAPWEVHFHLPPDDPSVEALLPILNQEILQLQNRYDLGMTNSARTEVTLAAA